MLCVFNALAMALAWRPGYVQGKDGDAATCIALKIDTILRNFCTFGHGAPARTHGVLVAGSCVSFRQSAGKQHETVLVVHVCTV